MEFRNVIHTHARAVILEIGAIFYNHMRIQSFILDLKRSKIVVVQEWKKDSYLHWRRFFDLD